MSENSKPANSEAVSLLKQIAENVKTKSQGMTPKQKAAALVCSILCIGGSYFGYQSMTHGKPVEVTPATIATVPADKEASVTFTVVSGRKLASGLVLLNDGAYPNHTFTAVVDSKACPSIQDWTSFKGRTVTVQGPKSEYQGKPQVKVLSPDKIIVK